LRYKSRILNLCQKLGDLQERMGKIEIKTFESILQNSKFNDSQKSIINEIYKSSIISNSKNRKYSENWILLCILFRIRYKAVPLSKY